MEILASFAGVADRPPEDRRRAGPRTGTYDFFWAHEKGLNEGVHRVRNLLRTNHVDGILAPLEEFLVRVLTDFAPLPRIVVRHLLTNTRHRLNEPRFRCHRKRHRATNWSNDAVPGTGYRDVLGYGSLFCIIIPDSRRPGPFIWCTIPK